MLLQQKFIYGRVVNLENIKLNLFISNNLNNIVWFRNVLNTDTFIIQSILWWCKQKKIIFFWKTEKWNNENLKHFKYILIDTLKHNVFQRDNGQLHDNDYHSNIRVTIFLVFSSNEQKYYKYYSRCYLF